MLREEAIPFNLRAKQRLKPWVRYVHITLPMESYVTIPIFHFLPECVHLPHGILKMAYAKPNQSGGVSKRKKLDAVSVKTFKTSVEGISRISELRVFLIS